MSPWYKGCVLGVSVVVRSRHGQVVPPGLDFSSPVYRAGLEMQTIQQHKAGKALFAVALRR